MLNDPKVVLNEWILHDLGNDNGDEGLVRGELALRILLEQPFQLCVPVPSPWLDKAYDLWKSDDPVVRRLSKGLWLGVLYDSDKTTYVDPSQLTETAKREAQIAPASDRYLVETLVSAGAQELVTTDGPLISSFVGHACIRVIHRDLFLARGA